MKGGKERGRVGEGKQKEGDGVADERWEGRGGEMRGGRGGEVTGGKGNRREGAGWE